jgi:hypothetical protein
LHLSGDSAAKPGTNTWTISSDIRLKEDIVAADLELCYDKIKQLPLKYYKWKDDVYTTDEVKDRHRVGWVAQDVQKVFNKAVDVGDMHGYSDCLTLNTDLIYANMFGAIQKLMKIVEDQEVRISDLENKITSKVYD